MEMWQPLLKEEANLSDIDSLIEKIGFKIALAEYTGDNSIVIFAEK